MGQQAELIEHEALADRVAPHCARASSPTDAAAACGLALSALREAISKGVVWRAILATQARELVRHRRELYAALERNETLSTLKGIERSVDQYRLAYYPRELRRRFPDKTGPVDAELREAYGRDALP